MRCRAIQAVPCPNFAQRFLTPLLSSPAPPHPNSLHTTFHSFHIPRSSHAASSLRTAAKFAELDTEILGISVDSQFSHLAWCQTDRKEGGVGDLKYPLVSDISKDISKAYNVLDPAASVALRGLFIIDKEGVIQHATINNLAFGRSVDETLRTLQAIQYVQANPDEVCPASWTPGQATMKPTPKDSKEFFAAL